MFTNLLVLPALLLSFNKRLMTRAFKKEGMVKFISEEEIGDAEVEGR